MSPASDRHSSIRSIRYNVLNLPYRVIYEGLVLQQPESRTIYDATGHCHAQLTGYTSYGRFSGDVKLYAGDYIVINDTIDRLITPYGYLRDGVFHSYVHDYQGNIMCVVTEDEVLQTNLYYPDGLPMTISTQPEANPFKYTGKELSLFRGHPVYDFTARHTLPALGNIFRTQDPCAESNQHVSVYNFCNGDPINNFDPTGEKTLQVDSLGNIISYTASPGETSDLVKVYDANGKVIASGEFELNSIKIFNLIYKDIIGLGFVINGNENGRKLFEILAQSKVEFALCQPNEWKSDQPNYITTTHGKNSERMMTPYISTKLVNRMKPEIHIHSHTNNTKNPSNYIEVDKDKTESKPKGDITAIRSLNKFLGYNLKCRIYLPGKRKYITYFPQSKKYDKPIKIDKKTRKPLNSL